MADMFVQMRKKIDCATFSNTPLEKAPIWLKVIFSGVILSVLACLSMAGYEAWLLWNVLGHN